MPFDLGKASDPDAPIGFCVLPILGTHPPVAYVSLADYCEIRTDDPRLLDLLAEKATKAARALRIAYGEKECEACGGLTNRLFERFIWIGGNSDFATDQERESIQTCRGCSGLSPDEIASMDELPNADDVKAVEQDAA